MTFTSDEFRQLMRRHPAAVTIIATGSAPHRTGLTATAVMSLSMDPSSIVCAVNRASFSYTKILQNKSLSVNTLALQHVSLAKVFSGQATLSGEDRFADEDWCTLTTGAPVLKSAVISLDCELLQTIETGSHALMIGKVVAGRQSPDEPALVYADGQWRCVDASASTTSSIDSFNTAGNSRRDGP
jgi:flavin reductase (DIM6/NTAB) family NADH-FMN oxidoreductase RutF